MQLIASLNPQPDGKYTVNIPPGDLKNITTVYYKPGEATPSTRPAELGDVYSFQPDGGGIVGRPAGTNGTWEVVTVDGLFMVIQQNPNGPVSRYSLINLS